MNARHSTTLISLALLMAACSATTDPVAQVMGMDEPEPSVSRGVRFAADAPELATYDTTLAVVQGEASIHEVHYRVGAGTDSAEVFLKVDVPHNAEWVDPDGNVLPPGSAVPLRVRIARDSLAFKFSPHGSTFMRPVKLFIDYAHTDLAGVDPSRLHMWYQPTDGTSWTEVPMTAELGDQWLRINLKHFSNYAVAF